MYQLPSNGFKYIIKMYITLLARTRVKCMQGPGTEAIKTQITTAYFTDDEGEVRPVKLV